MCICAHKLTADGLEALNKDKKGIQSIVSALRVHSSNDQVAQYACAAMVNISVYDNSMKNAIADCGGISAVITAIKEHPNNYDVCKCGCAVLGTLSSGNRKICI